MDTKTTGNFGEQLAEKYLLQKGYRILGRNYSFRIPENPQKGEIDIITKKDDTISFVEVKTLRQTGKGNFLPEDKVNFSKQKKIIRTAESWLTENKIPLNSKWQVDIISIILHSKKVDIHHFKNALSQII